MLKKLQGGPRVNKRDHLKSYPTSSLAMDEEVINTLFRLPIERAIVWLSTNKIQFEKSTTNWKYSTQVQLHETFDLRRHIYNPHNSPGWSCKGSGNHYPSKRFARENLWRLRSPNNIVTNIFIQVDTIKSLKEFLPNICFSIKGPSPKFHLPFLSFMIPMTKICN